jgi:hypothetical protein
MERRTGIEPAGKRDADALAGRNMLKDGSHEGSIIARSRTARR